MSRHRAHRLWRNAGLQLPRRRPRRPVATSRPRPLPGIAPNYVWAYDFVFDACANSQQLKCLTVIDEFTRECLAIDVAGSIRSGRVIEALARLISQHGAPPPCALKTARSSSVRQSWSGPPRRRSRPPTSTPESRGRTPTTRASTASSATSACRSNGSGVAPRRRSSSKPGVATPTRSDRIRVWTSSLRSSSRRVTIPPTRVPFPSSEWSEIPWAGHWAGQIIFFGKTSKKD